ncbi:MAG TPA: fused MFS/spermidine synthase, partial [Planctomycetota bacterium]|nr:fused MFS/spermidine synthase [Planctomycetota bacterium]
QYVHCLTFFAGHYPKGANVLVLGLGGGSLANELVRLDFNVDAVELDERIARIARDHFALDPAVNVFVDDARRYVRSCKKRYSFIGLDCFTAEREPTHLLTIESIRDMSRVLEPDGMFVLDYRGYLDGKRGLGARCILRTIAEAGYQPIAYGTVAGEDDRDLILGGLRNPKRFWRERSLRLNQDCCAAAANEMTRHVLQCDLDDAYVLTDDRSPLDVLNTVYHERWRISAREGFAEMLKGR